MSRLCVLPMADRSESAVYIPNAFAVSEPEKLAAFIREHSFAVLITINRSVPFASHLPLQLVVAQDGRQSLVGHMARANDQWRHFQEDTEVLAIFNGPHSYVSPSWYSTELAVPTWNYAAVHVYGRPSLIQEHSRIVALLEDLAEIYESGLAAPWPGPPSDEFRDRLMVGIVAFEIEITRIEGKFKLGQNRIDADRDRVYQQLAGSKSETHRSLAAMMLQEGLVSSAGESGITL
jgi:transcriptional regulator